MLFNYGRPHPAPGAAAPAARPRWLRSAPLPWPAPRRPLAAATAPRRRRLPAALPPRVLEPGRRRRASPGVGGAPGDPGGGAAAGSPPPGQFMPPASLFQVLFLSWGNCASPAARWSSPCQPSPLAPGIVTLEFKEFFLQGLSMRGVGTATVGFEGVWIRALWRPQCGHW